MYNTKTLLAAASLAVLSAVGIGSASAAPWDNNHRDGARTEQRHEQTRFAPDANRDHQRDGWNRGGDRHDFRRSYVQRERVFETLRFHNFRGIGDPYFFQGRYVVRSHDRFGHVVLVEIDRYTGAFIRVVRI